MKNNPARTLFKFWASALEHTVPKGDCMALGDPRVGIFKQVDNFTNKITAIHFGRVHRTERWSTSNLATFGERYFSLKPNGDFQLHHMTVRGFGNAWNKRQFVENQVPFLHYGWHTRELCWVPKRPDEIVSSQFDNSPELAYVSERVLGNYGYYHSVTPWLRLRETDERLEFAVAPGQRKFEDRYSTTFSWKAWDQFAALREKRVLRQIKSDRGMGRASLLPALNVDGEDLSHVESFYRLAALMPVSQPARTITPLKRPKEARNDHVATSH